MAQTVFLRLQINGNDIEGESTVRSFDREGTIECSSFHCGLTAPFDAATGQVTRPQPEPVKIHKRVDRTSPLFLKALHQQERVEAEFMFFQPSPEGRDEHFFTVQLKSGYVSSVRQASEDVIMAGEKAPPMMEEVVFVYRAIIWMHTQSGSEHGVPWIVGK